MRRTSTQFGYITLLAFVLACGALAGGQSLGDVARENREKKASNPSARAKVITNTDLGIDPEGDAPEDEAASSPKSGAASRKAEEQRAAEQRAAEQWKQKILAQKRTIANLQVRVDALRSSIEFVDPNGYSNGYVYNRFQARQLERLKIMEAELAEQKQKLDDMQDTARRAGMHTAVYDP